MNKTTIERKPVADRTDKEHLFMIKHKHRNSVRAYLLSMGKFKDVPIDLEITPNGEKKMTEIIEKKTDKQAGDYGGCGRLDCCFYPGPSLEGPDVHQECRLCAHFEPFDLHLKKRSSYPVTGPDNLVKKIGIPKDPKA